MGNPIATTDPNATSMMIIALRIPAPSLGPGEAVITLPIGPPPSATLYPGRSKDSAASITERTAALGMVDWSWSNWTTANAMCPSEEIWCDSGVNGLSTRVTCGSAESFATIASVWARSAPEVTGPVVETTTSAVEPAVCGKRAARRFCTCCEAEFPDSKEIWNRLPIDWATIVTTTIAAIQRISTLRRWTTHQLASLPSPEVSGGVRREGAGVRDFGGV